MQRQTRAGCSQCWKETVTPTSQKQLKKHLLSFSFTEVCRIHFPDMDVDKKEYFVQREILDDARLDEVAKKGTWSTKPAVAERVKESLR